MGLLSPIIRSPRETTLKRFIILAALLVGSGGLAVGQAGIDASVLDKLKRLFPAATTFTPKEGEPLHFSAYTGDGRGGRSLLGYAFWTTEVVPLERGYGGPIVMLVGLDTKGLISGIIIGDHREPYGNFSIDMPQFSAQFRNKDIRDPFKLGEDIDAVSRATITMSSAVRSIRNASRRVARTLLAPPAAAKP
jgi:NosR/NirI family nitrous oxide reductase transcriptional regulator